MRPSLAIAILTALLAPRLISASGISIVGFTNTVWHYHSNPEPPTTDWALPGFDDGAWPTGRGLFGNESNYPFPMNTPVLGPSQGGPNNAYYRTRFQWAGSVAGVIFSGKAHVDDGCVIYLNGIELARLNMPAGEITPSTMAPGTLVEPVSIPIQLDLSSLTNGNPNPLAVGENVLAAEVHQNSGTSSDHVFGLALQSVPGFPCAIVHHPTSQVAIACQSASFTVVPHFECFNPSFQWYFAPSNSPVETIAGATQSTLTLPNVRFEDAGQYFCQLANFTGGLESQRATLTVLPNTNAPSIRFSYREGQQIHVVFDRPIRMQGGDNDPSSWQVSPMLGGQSLTVVAARLTNESHVVIQVAEVLFDGDFYTSSTRRDISSNCGEGVLNSGAATRTAPLLRVIDFEESILTWRYNDTGIDPGPNWNQSSFDDTGWKSGQQVFEAASPRFHQTRTLMEFNYPNSNPPQRIPTYQFRTRFSNCYTYVLGAIAEVMHDDGMVLYVNGREVFRRGIADDRFDSFGGSTQSPELTVQESIFIDRTNFVMGENLIAVTVKQAIPTSGDIVMGMRLQLVDGGHGDPAPVQVVQQPQSQTVIEGRSWSMEVTVSADPCGNVLRNYQYQWYRNGLPLPGGTGPRITGVAKPSDAGVYHAEISNEVGSTRSADATLQVRPVTLSYRAQWRYQTNSQDSTLVGTGARWFAPEFDDSSWPADQAPFAREFTTTTMARLPSPIATPLPAPEPNLQTTYFRKLVTIPEVPAGQILILCHTIDDGAAIYIDGQLVQRFNLTNSLPISFTNTTPGETPGDGDARIVCAPLTISPGEHLIAVEVHQGQPVQSDVYFGLELRLATPPSDLAIKRNGPGNYFLQWTNDPFWDLVESAQITGPYSRASGNSTSPYSLPPSSTNRFYRLLFHGR